MAQLLTLLLSISH